LSLRHQDVLKVTAEPDAESWQTKSTGFYLIFYKCNCSLIYVVVGQYPEGSLGCGGAASAERAHAALIRKLRVKASDSPARTTLRPFRNLSDSQPHIRKVSFKTTLAWQAQNLVFRLSERHQPDSLVGPSVRLMLTRDNGLLVRL
jgi:hypothetical protein